MTAKFQPTDPDLIRLINGDFVPKDTPEKVITRIQTAIRNRNGVTEADIDAIPDKSTRETIRRWNELFP